MDLDEDEMARFLADEYRDCPYYVPGDEYCVYRLRERKAMAFSGCNAIKMPNPIPKSATKIEKMTSMETPHFLFLSSLLRV